MTTEQNQSHLNTDWSAWNSRDKDGEVDSESKSEGSCVKYDSDENITFYQCANGFWVERKYSKCGKVTFERNSLDFEYEACYDENSNLTWYENNEGYWKSCVYDARGLKIGEADSTGRRVEYAYDMWGNLIT